MNLHDKNRQLSSLNVTAQFMKLYQLKFQQLPRTSKNADGEAACEHYLLKVEIALKCAEGGQAMEDEGESGVGCRRVS